MSEKQVMFNVIGETLEHVWCLDPDFNFCVYLRKEEDVEQVEKKGGYDIYETEDFSGEKVWMVTAQHKNFFTQCRSKLSELVDLSNKNHTVHIKYDVKGNMNSQRVAIYTAGKSLGLSVSVKVVGHHFHVSRKKAVKKKDPYFYSLIKEYQGLPTLVTYKNISLPSFRAKVYAWAKRKGVRVSFSPKEGSTNECYITYHGKIEESKNKAQLFNEFFETIKPGESKSLPDELADAKDNYIRVTCSKNGLFYRGKQVHRPNPAPHIDNHGNFHMNGKNYGPKSIPWMTIALRKAGYEPEEVLK